MGASRPEAAGPFVSPPGFHARLADADGIGDELGGDRCLCQGVPALGRPHYDGGRSVRYSGRPGRQGGTQRNEVRRPVGFDDGPLFRDFHLLLDRRLFDRSRRMGRFGYPLLRDYRFADGQLCQGAGRGVGGGLQGRLYAASRATERAGTR